MQTHATHQPQTPKILKTNIYLYPDFAYHVHVYWMPPVRGGVRGKKLSTHAHKTIHIQYIHAIKPFWPIWFYLHAYIITSSNFLMHLGFPREVAVWQDIVSFLPNNLLYIRNLVRYVGFFKKFPNGFLYPLPMFEHRCSHFTLCALFHTRTPHTYNTCIHTHTP